MSKLSEAKHHISVQVDMDELDVTAAESKATYEEIQEWVQEKYGFHVTHLNIAKTKRKCGIIERQNYNLPKSENSRSPETPKEKEEAIIDAFLHFCRALTSDLSFTIIGERKVTLLCAEVIMAGGT